MTMLRGYMLNQTVAFIQSGYFAPAASARIMDELPHDVTLALEKIKPAEWYSREYLTAMLRGIVNVKNNESESYEDLVAYGLYVSNEATNTFLKLLLKMLTPALFIKKVPEFWQRDHRGSGRIEVDVSNSKEGSASMRLLGVGGFDHIGVSAIGFLLGGLRTMGRKDIEVIQHGWSLATPGPDEVRYEVKWT